MLRIPLNSTSSIYRYTVVTKLDCREWSISENFTWRRVRLVANSPGSSSASSPGRKVKKVGRRGRRKRRNTAGRKTEGGEEWRAESIVGGTDGGFGGDSGGEGEEKRRDTLNKSHVAHGTIF
jgi:hypothetical protein